LHETCRIFFAELLPKIDLLATGLKETTHRKNLAAICLKCVDILPKTANKKPS
jgi:hypothetical protein